MLSPPCALDLVWLEGEAKNKMPKKNIFMVRTLRLVLRGRGCFGLECLGDRGGGFGQGTAGVGGWGYKAGKTNQKANRKEKGSIKETGIAAFPFPHLGLGWRRRLSSLVHRCRNLLPTEGIRQLRHRLRST